MKKIHLMALALILTLAIASACSSKEPWQVLQRDYRMIDLTHTLENGIPYFPGGIPFSLTKYKTLARDGYTMHTITMSEHTGTHIDAPSHFLEEGREVDKLEIDHLCGPAVVLDIRDSVKQSSDYALSISDVEKFESRYGHIPRGSFVLVNTGWSEKWKNPKTYLNQDEKGIMHFPGVSKEAAEILVKGRKVYGIGIDTLSLDPGLSQDFSAHKVVLGYDRIIIENLFIPGDLPPRGAFVCVFPLPVKGGSGSPARVIAWVK